MATERSKRRDLLALSFITKSISKKLLIKKDNGDAKFWVATVVIRGCFTIQFRLCLFSVIS